MSNQAKPTAPDDAPLRAMEQAVAEHRLADALDAITALSERQRGSFTILAREVDLLGKLGRHDEEIAGYRRLLDFGQHEASVRLGLAHTLKTVGRTDEAIAEAHRAIAERPAYGKAWWLLSELKSFRFSDDQVGTMESLLAGDLDTADRLHLHFALGRAFEGSGQAEQAFEQYRLGNALLAASVPPQATAVSHRVDRIIATCTAEFFRERSDWGAASDEPIFIVGLNRSGSTLVEQILGSHPAIEATSELPLMSRLFREMGESVGGSDNPYDKMAALGPDRARAFGEAYLQRASAYRRTDKPHFIDKMPANWLHVGFIRLILPNARIIDARRHPMATGFSNFRQLYGTGVEWSYSLATIGRYYGDYVRLMRHLDRVLPGAVHRVVNERLIADFEPEVRRLLDHVGVPFDANCLDFHRSGAAVRSASAEQVRRPVNRDGIDQWRAFQPWLGDLETALGPALQDWDEA